MEGRNSEFEKVYQIKNGLCLIINIINFDERKYMKRIYSEKTVKLVREAFKYVGFDVIEYSDLNNYELLKTIESQINKEECSSYDAFVLYISSHGKRDEILCKNNQTIYFHQITKCFKDKNCENFVNKPKIIFLDCCRLG